MINRAKFLPGPFSITGVLEAIVFLTSLHGHALHVKMLHGRESQHLPCPWAASGHKDSVRGYKTGGGNCRVSLGWVGRGRQENPPVSPPTAKKV